MATDSWLKELGGDPDVDRALLRSGLVWPIRAEHPVNAEARADFFDTLYHADAIVGLNTSAMIEASILGKPILTFLGHEATASQTHNLHYRYLIDGGFVQQGRDLNEHFDQLSAVLDDPSGAEDACRRFVADFVRPLGREHSASDELATRILGEMGLHMSEGKDAVAVLPDKQSLTVA